MMTAEQNRTERNGIEMKPKNSGLLESAISRINLEIAHNETKQFQLAAKVARKVKGQIRQSG